MGGWLYNFPMFDRTTWVTQPGDFLILGVSRHPILIELKSTIAKKFYKNLVKPTQILQLSKFGESGGTSFVVIYYQRSKSYYLIPFFNYITLPTTVNEADAAIAGTLVTDNWEELLGVI